MSLLEFVEHTHPDYEAQKLHWEFLRHSYIGGPEYVVSGNLHPHTFEDETLYKSRLRRAYFYNYSSPIVNAYQSFLYREDVKRNFGIYDGETDSDSLFGAFLDSANRARKTYDEIVRDAAKWSSIFGIYHWLIDKPSTTAETREEELAEDLFPYIVEVSPLDLLDWSVDSKGELLWIKIREKNVLQPQFNMDSVPLEKYRVWYRDRWEEYTVVTDKGKRSAILTGEASHPIGEVPLVSFLHYSDQPMVGISLLNDIAYVNRALFNHCSLLDEILYRQTFSQLVLPEDPNNPISDVELGTARGLGFPVDSRHPPAFISPDSGQAQILMQQIQAGVEEIYRLATLRGAIGVTEQSSGVARSYDFMITNNTLSNKASNMENAEQRALEIWARWMEQENEELRIQYPREFDIQLLEDDIRNLLEIQTLNISNKFEELLKKQIVRKTLPRLSDEEMEEIEAEIESQQGSQNTPPEFTPPEFTSPDSEVSQIIDETIAATPGITPEEQ